MGLLSGILGGGGSGGSAPNNTQNTATAAGQGINAQGNKNSIGNTTTNVKSDSRISSVKDSNNKIAVANGGSVNYTTNNAGISGADLATFGNEISKAAGGGSGGGVQVSNATPGAAAVMATASTVRWGLIAGIVGAVIAAIYFFKSK